jgi:hypothetical protein
VFPVRGASGYSEGSGPVGSHPTSQGDPGSSPSGLIESVKLLGLYTIEQGRMHTRLYDRKDILRERPLEVEGYVSGVVLLLNGEMDVQLDGAALSRIRERDDGTLLCKHFGRLNDDDSIFPYVEPLIQEAPGRLGEGPDETPSYLPGGYSCFPKVRGSGVSPLDRFSISLRRGKASRQITIRHQGERALWEFQAGSGRSVPIVTHGRALSDRSSGRDHLRKRLRAFGQGVRSVEARFGADLVSRVHLVDRRQIRNAVTCKGQSEIWLYVDTLLEEPLEELKTIAEHETLHLLVDREGLTDDAAIRKHFADLKGFGMLSCERFLLVSQGVMRDPDTASDEENTLFFSFIDERNFIEGMKGGHSHDNLDEFCTSFLHSVMFFERLGERLNRPVALTRPRRDRRRLTPEEALRVLETYEKTARLLRRAVAAGNGSDHSTGQIIGLLEGACFEAITEQARRFWSERPSSNDDRNPS